ILRDNSFSYHKDSVLYDFSIMDDSSVIFRDSIRWRMYEYYNGYSPTEEGVPLNFAFSLNKSSAYLKLVAVNHRNKNHADTFLFNNPFYKNTEKCDSLKVKFVMDFNGNCLADPGEIPITGLWAGLTGHPHYAGKGMKPDANGELQLVLPDTGSYGFDLFYDSLLSMPVK